MRSILFRSIVLGSLLTIVTCGAAFLIGLALGGDSIGWLTLAAFGLLAESLVLLLASYNGPLAPKANVAQFPTALDSFVLEQAFRRGPERQSARVYLHRLLAGVVLAVLGLALLAG